MMEKLLLQLLLLVTLHLNLIQGSITYNSQTKEFLLQGPKSSYSFRIGGLGSKSGEFLEHLHWGKKTGAGDSLGYLGWESLNPISFDPERKNGILTEWSDFGTGDFRSPSFQVRYSNGTNISPLVYVSHTITNGKPSLDPSQPSLYVESASEASTLEIVLRDPMTSLQVHLYYTQYTDFDVIVRRSKITAPTSSPVPAPWRLERLLSATVDFPFANEYHLSHLSGAWARERHLVTRKLDLGTSSIESRRGASSHQHNPFALISTSPPKEESGGDHYAFNLVYSGNFLIDCEVIQSGRLRVNVGINPFNFEWKLNPGESFISPEVVMAHSGEGYGGISRELHRLYRTRLARGHWRDLPRPILVNSWEAMYFDVSEEKILNNLAKPAGELGIELVVLDDGWFGRRENDRCCLGDWVLNRDKFPSGLASLANQINALGMSFGIWMEPEMISRDSDLYRLHPDWVLHTGDRYQTESRNQLVLDLTRRDVRDYLVESVTNILSSGNIEYLKWDFNRHLTEVSSEVYPFDQQGEVSHRFVLGVYDIMERITQRFPKVLFESCSGGGGRFDPGMIYYMPQIWTSDNTDAISRAKIQYGTSIPYPASVMGAHVSHVPNEQNGRITSMRTRSLMALSGTYGYELDLLHLSDEDRALIKVFVSLHKNIEPIVRLGDMYRLSSPFESKVCSWMFVSEDKKRAVVFAFNSEYFEQVWHYPLLPLRGLRDNSSYKVSPFDVPVSPFRLSSLTLMSAGLPLTFFGDSGSVLYVLDEE